MENAIYIGIARQKTLQDQMNVIAQNIANVNTTGYRANRVLFDTYVEKPDGMKPDMAFPTTIKTYRATETGSFRRTDNQLDVALEGDGFLSVQGPNNQTVYTRAGNLKLNANNQIVTPQGYPVLGQGGPITIPNDNKSITISPNGDIAGDTGLLDQLKIVEFDKPADMKPLGNTMYEGVGAPKTSTKTKVVQGSVEAANVQGVLEMTNMIDVLRNFQAVQRMLQTEDQRMRDMINSVTRVQA